MENFDDKLNKSNDTDKAERSGDIYNGNSLVATDDSIKIGQVMPKTIGW